MQVFKKEEGPCNSDKPGTEEGIIITDCEGASILVCDCASLAPGPLLNTFK